MLQIIERDERAHGVSLDWYNNRELVVIAAVGKPTRNTIDVVIDVFYEVATHWDVSKPYMVGFEVKSQALLTPYARERFGETTNMNPDVWGRYALIVQHSLLGQTIVLYFNREYSTRTSTRLLGRAFVRRETAINWLWEIKGTTRP